jgi:tetratricopeptide (TPR) repeat protein
MKKLMMMAMMLVASATAFAGDSDALKSVLKSKNYAEAAQMVKQSLGQLADNAEKAKAYNHLVDLAMAKVQNETGIIAENQLAAMGQGKVKEYDALGLADGICDAIDAAVECDKFDQQPDAKGKVKPKFAEKNAQRVWAVRQHLVNIGQEQAAQNNDAGVLKYWGAFIDSAENPFFAACDHNPEKEYVGQVAFFAGRYAYQAGEMDRANRYFEVAKRDPQQKADAVNFQLYAMRQQLKTHADSVAYVNQLKQMYEQEPENDVVIDGINSMYEGMKDKEAQAAFLDAHLAKYPNSFTALANKGLMAVNANNAEEGAKWLRKASEAKPDNAVVWTYLGACLSVLAANATDNATGTKYYDEAIAAFDKAKELDPERQLANWGYNRYQAYYGRYGADDPKTKAAEADMK